MVIPAFRWRMRPMHATVTCSRAGKSNTDGGGRSQVDPTRWMYGSDIVTMHNASSLDYLASPIAAMPANLASPFTSTSSSETSGTSSASS